MCTQVTLVPYGIQSCTLDVELAVIGSSPFLLYWGYLLDLLYNSIIIITVYDAWYPLYIVHALAVIGIALHFGAIYWTYYTIHYNCV